MGHFCFNYKNVLFYLCDNDNSIYKSMHNINPRKLFLIDCLGAMVSAVMLAVVLPKFESLLGMPSYILHLLALPACAFAVYSLFCFWRTPTNWRPYMRLIALLNLLYCCLTLGLVIYLYPQLTIWGIAYFVGEMTIIAALAMFEFRTAAKS